SLLDAINCEFALSEYGASVIEKNIQLRKTGAHLVGEAPDFRLRGKIGCDEHRLRTLCGLLNVSLCGHAACLVPANHNDCEALRSERFGGRKANTAIGTGDEYGLLCHSDETHWAQLKTSR